MSEEFHTPLLEPAILVIFGITGDLSQRKLLPALYHLVKDDLLDEHTQIVGLSRRDSTVDQLLDAVELCVLEQDNVCDPEVLTKIRYRLSMFTMNPAEPDDYTKLMDELDRIEDKHGVCMNRLFYLAIPPNVYGSVIRNLGEHKLNGSCRHKKAKSRLLVEKPFGYDLATAGDLIEETSHYFKENQIYRIDHYLAKESAQNILTFRRHNPVFLDGWNSEHISRIDVIAHEKIGVEGRASFYDQVGALRDIVQSHLLQLLTLVTIEASINGTDNPHEAKEKFLKSLSPVDPSKAIRGQYDGYREEISNPTSLTETYVKLELASSLPQWKGTVMGLETGKAMSEKKTEIHVTFTDEASSTSNILTFRIQPNEGIDLQLTAKKPGFDRTLQTVSMDFSYHGVFNEPIHPDAYERVLVDAVRGDQSLFASSGEVLASWQALQPILDYWQRSENILVYKQGAAEPVQETAVST